MSDDAQQPGQPVPSPQLAAAIKAAITRPLPSWMEILADTMDGLNAAREKLGDARDSLNSDWHPDAGPKSDSARDRGKVFQRLSTLEGDIDAAKRDIWAMLDAEEAAAKRG